MNDKLTVESLKELAQKKNIETAEIKKYGRVLTDAERKAIDREAKREPLRRSIDYTEKGIAKLKTELANVIVKSKIKLKHSSIHVQTEVINNLCTQVANLEKTQRVLDEKYEKKKDSLWVAFTRESVYHGNEYYKNNEQIRQIKSSIRELRSELNLLEQYNREKEKLEKEISTKETELRKFQHELNMI